MENNLQSWISQSGILDKKVLPLTQKEKALLRYLESLSGQRLSKEKINQLVQEFLVRKK